MLTENLTFKGEIECDCGEVRRMKRPVNSQQLEQIVTSMQERHGKCEHQQPLPGTQEKRTVTTRRSK